MGDRVHATGLFLDDGKCRARGDSPTLQQSIPAEGTG